MLVIEWSQNSAERTFFQTGRPLVVPIKNIAAVFTGDFDSRHSLGLEFS